MAWVLGCLLAYVIVGVLFALYDVLILVPRQPSVQEELDGHPPEVRLMLFLIVIVFWWYIVVPEIWRLVVGLAARCRKRSTPSVKGEP